MSNRVLVFSDLQAHTHHAYARSLPNGRNTRLKAATDCLKYIIDFARENRIRDVVFCGDLFETKNRIPMVVLQEVCELIVDSVVHGLRWFMIPGNHDYAVRNGEVHALALLRGHEDIYIFDEDWSRVPFHNFGASLDSSMSARGGVPTLIHTVKYAEKLPVEVFDVEPDEGSLRVLLAHGYVEGMCDFPHDFPEDEMAQDGEWIRRAWLRGFDAALVGHYHKPMVENIHGCQVIVPGCPYQEKSDAMGQERGFFVWDLDSREATKHVIPESVAPRFVKVSIGADGVVEEEVASNSIVLLEPAVRGVPADVIKQARQSLMASGASYVEPLTLPRTPVVRVERPAIEVGTRSTPLSVLKRVLRSDAIDLRGCSLRELERKASAIIAEHGLLRKGAKGGSPVVEMYLSARDAFAFGRVDVELTDQGLLGVGGVNMETSQASSNGAGKSTLPDVVSLVLFGKSLRNVRADETIRRGARSYRGMIRFATSDGKRYEIFRCRKDKEFGGGLFFRKGWGEYDLEEFELPGKDVDMRGGEGKETQDHISASLSMGFGLFRALVLLGEGGDFRFAALGDSAKKDVLSDILGVSFYDDLAKNARSLANTLSDEQDKLEAEAGVLLSEKEDANREWHVVQESLVRWERKHLYEIQGAEETLVAAQKVLRLADEKIIAPAAGSSVTELKDTRVRVLEFRELLEQAREDHAGLLEEANESALASQSKVVGLLSDVRSVEAQLKDRRDLIARGRCGECGQIVTEDVCEGKLSELEGRLAELQEDLHVAKGRKSSLSAIYNDRLVSSTGDTSELEETLGGFRARVEELEADGLLIAQAKDRRAQAARLHGIRRDEVERLKAEANPHTGESERLVGRSARLVTERDIKLREQASKHLDMLHYKVLADAFGPKGARSMLFDELMPQLNDRLELYSDLFCGGYIRISVQSQSETARGKVQEKIGLVVDFPSGSCSYGSCSAGEKRRVDLPVLFALQDVAAAYGVGLGFCFLDEAFENVDAAGKVGLMDLLSEVSGRSHTSTVFVVTHDEDLLGLFDPVMWCYRVGGRTSLFFGTSTAPTEVPA